MAEGATLTAGTFIAAVMEQAGYMTQAEFLVSFRDFFREAGALLYIVGAIGALISMLLFGSFRAARYLLIGPALYWFLVGPTAQFDGTIWQIGNGVPRGLREHRGEQMSKEDISLVLEEAGYAGKTSGPYEVAYAFSLFVRVIDSIAKELSNAILGDEKEYLNFISKGRALDYLIGIEPNDTLTNEMIDNNLVTQCMEMFGYGLQLGAYDLNPESIQFQGSATQTAEARRALAMEKYDLARAYKPIQLNTAETSVLTKFIEVANTAMNTPGSTELDGLDVERLRQVSARYNGQVPEKIICDDVWRYVATSIQGLAIAATEEALNIAKGDAPEMTAELRDETCRVLEKKLVALGEESSGECHLENIVAMLMFKNAVAQRQPMARFAQILANRTVEKGRLNDGLFIPLDVQRMGASVLDMTGPAKQYGTPIATEIPIAPFGIPGMIGGGLLPPSVSMGKVESYEFAPDTGGDEEFHDRRRWQAAAVLTSVGGATDAAFTELPKFNLRNLRQQLFSWGLHVPYWQGVMLYILAIAYPFMALVVLIPGRAVSFLNLPLAWLWIKSWDVGYTMVMIFERVLWNIFPSLQIPESLRTQPLNNVELWEALGETQKYDHIWNLHMYYLLLALATLSIPVIMGYGTIRGRRAILSSFTDRLIKEVKDSGDASAAGEKLLRSSTRAQVMRDFRGLATQKIGVRSEGGLGTDIGYFGGGRGETAAFFGTMALTTGLLEKNFRRGEFMANGVTGNVSGVLNAAEQGRSTFMNILDKQYSYDRMTTIMDDPVFGRWGHYQKLFDALGASFDTSGGSEMNDQMVAATDEFIDLFTTKIDVTARNTEKVFVEALMTGMHQAMTQSARIGQAASAAGELPGALGGIGGVGLAGASAVVVGGEAITDTAAGAVRATQAEQFFLGGDGTKLGQAADWAANFANEKLGLEVDGPAFLRQVYNIEPPRTSPYALTPLDNNYSLDKLADPVTALEPMNLSNHREHEIPAFLAAPQNMNFFNPVWPIDRHFEINEMANEPSFERRDEEMRTMFPRSAPPREQPRAVEGGQNIPIDQPEPRAAVPVEREQSVQGFRQRIESIKE